MNSSKLLYYNFSEEINSFNKNQMPISFKNEEVQSFYCDDIWNFSHENSQNVVRRINQISFISLNNYPLFKEAMKDALYRLLSNGIKSSSLTIIAINMKVFFEYCLKNFKIENLNEVKIEHIRLYINEVINLDLSYSSCKSRLLLLENCFYKYRKELKYKIDFHPFGGQALKKIIHKSNKVKNNKQTEIISDIAWKDIISKSIEKIKQYQSNLDIEMILHEKWIREYKLKAHIVNKSKQLEFRKTFKISSFMIKSKGLKQYKSITEYKSYIKEIIVACGILIQAFTGMRISELISLKKDCCTKEEIELNGNKVTINKITGLTFKYEKEPNGRKADWLCPDIVKEAITILEKINTVSHYIYQDKGFENYLFNLSSVKGTENFIIYDVSKDYRIFLLNNNIKLDFELTSHCFRRTLARFFARNLLNLPVETLKEQFKHFSKDITLYYMKEDLKNEGYFNELVNDYITDDKLLYEEVNNKFNNSILSANNLDEIRCFINGRQVNLINQYMANMENTGISPLKSLTCEGTIILPNIHIDYWKEMLVLYEELIELEPNSIWYKNEHKMIKNVMKDLEIGNAHIVKGII